MLTKPTSSKLLPHRPKFRFITPYLTQEPSKFDLSQFWVEEIILQPTYSSTFLKSPKATNKSWTF